MTVAVAQARKELKTIANAMRGLLALDEALDKVGSVEALIEQKQAQVADMDRRLAAYAAKIEDADAREVAAREKVEAEMAKAREAVNEALSKAASIRADANAQADKARQEAAAEADRIVREAETVKAGVEAKVTAQQGTLRKLQDEVAEAERRRDAINKEMARLKQMMAGG